MPVEVKPYKARAYLQLALNSFGPEHYRKYMEKHFLGRLRKWAGEGVAVVDVSALARSLADMTHRSQAALRMRLVRAFDKGDLVGKDLYVQAGQSWVRTSVLWGVALPLLRGSWTPKKWSRVLVTTHPARTEPPGRPASWFHTETPELPPPKPPLRPSWLKASRALAFCTVAPTGTLKGLSVIALKPTHSHPYVTYTWGFLARDRKTKTPTGFWLGPSRSWLPAPRHRTPVWALTQSRTRQYTAPRRSRSGETLQLPQDPQPPDQEGQTTKTPTPVLAGTPLRAGT